MAGKNFGRVNVSITASTGGLTAGLGRASKQLGGFAGQAQGIGGRLQAMAAGFVGAGNAASVAAIGVKTLGLAIKTLLGPLLIVTSLVSLFARFGKTASDIDRVGKAATRLGLSTDTLQAFEGAASEAGVSAEKVTTMVTFMNRQIGEAANGSKTAQKQFARLGLSLDDFAGLGTAERFQLISERIQALPFEERASAAMLFGRAGADGLNFISAAAKGAVTDMKQLQTFLGVSITDKQRVGVEAMNDALARTGMVFQGFISQFLVELAPTIATVANLFVKFFAENASGFNMATTLASALGQAIRGIAGAVTFLYGAFQVLSSFVGVFITGALKAFEGVTWALGNMLSAMADAAEALPGFDLGISSGLRAASDSVNSLSTAAGDEAALWGTAAAENFGNGIQNISDPFAAFYAEFASVTAQMQQAGAAAGEAAGSAIGPAIAASTQALKAIVAGTGEGEAFRNSIMRGADPRLDGAKDQARTADASEQSAESLEEIEASLAGLGGGIGLATISV
jgi:hypothetical protein